LKEKDKGAKESEASTREERETAPELGAGGFIKNQQTGEFFLVENEARWSIPVGHKKKADRTLRETFFREMKEEIGLESEEIIWLESFGTVFVQKDENSPRKLFEIYYIKVGAQTAQKLKYSEKGKQLSVWLRREKIETMPNLDKLAKAALRLYREKYVSSKIIVGGGYDKERVLSGGENRQF